MLYHSSILAVLTVLAATSAAPLAIPLGSHGESLTTSDDGQSISVGGQTVDLGQAGGRKRKGDKGGGAAAAGSNAKAIYFITNTANNSIVALKVAADGTVSDGSVTATGGAGMSGFDSSGSSAAPDALFSQGSVKVAGNSNWDIDNTVLFANKKQNLIAVNPGSNTMSMFSISSTDPTKLTAVGQPVNTIGEFPTSVTISTTLSQACVANSGAKAGVACFSMSASGLTPLDNSLRSFDLNQTTPPSGPLNTVSQVFFNSDSSALMTTVKGDPTKNNTGFLSVFPVTNKAVSMIPINSSPAGTAVLFGTALISNSSNLFVTDASFGSATLSLSPSNIASVSASTKIADQSATCWATISDVTGTAFVTDVAVNHLVEVDTTTGELVNELKSSNGNPGMIDLESKGNFIYALSPGNATVKAAVTVFDVSGGRGSVREVQNWKVGGVTDSAQGMAVF